MLDLAGNLVKQHDRSQVVLSDRHLLPWHIWSLPRLLCHPQELDALEHFQDRALVLGALVILAGHVLWKIEEAEDSIFTQFCLDRFDEIVDQSQLVVYDVLPILQLLVEVLELDVMTDDTERHVLQEVVDDLVLFPLLLHVLDEFV